MGGGGREAWAEHITLKEAGTRLLGGGESAALGEGSRLVKRVGLGRSKCRLGELLRRCLNTAFPGCRGAGAIQRGNDCVCVCVFVRKTVCECVYEKEREMV